MSHDCKVDEKVLTRFSRLEGQVRGVKEMCAQGRDCIDILTQISAIQSALTQASKLVMLSHIEHILNDATDISKDESLEEIKDIINRFSKTK